MTYRHIETNSYVRDLEDILCRFCDVGETFESDVDWDDELPQDETVN